MISLLSMLLSALSDDQGAGLQRARLHELRGRLGLQTPPQQSDLRSRMLWAMKHYDMTALDAFTLIVMVADTVEWHEELPRVADIECHTLTGALLSQHQRRMSQSIVATLVPDSVLNIVANNITVRVEEEGAILDLAKLSLPEPGLRWRHERIVPWLARQIIRKEEHERYDIDVLPFLLDWIEAESPNLSAYSWDEAMEAADRWHHQFHRSGDELIRVEPGVPVAAWDDGRTLQRLVTRAQLQGEGAYMEHCVEGYWPDVRDGSSIILSYRDAQGRPLATLELEPGSRSPFRIVQVQGPRNTSVDRKHEFPLIAALVQLARPARPHSIAVQVAPRLAIIKDRDTVDIAERQIQHALRGGRLRDIHSALTSWFAMMRCPILLQSRILSQSIPAAEGDGHGPWVRIGRVTQPTRYLLVHTSTGHFALSTAMADVAITSKGDSLLDLLAQEQLIRPMRLEILELVLKEHAPTLLMDLEGVLAPPE